MVMKEGDLLKEILYQYILGPMFYTIELEK